MKITRKEVEGHLKSANLDSEIKLHNADGRIGNGKMLFLAKGGKSGTITPLTDCYTYSEMTAFLIALQMRNRGAIL